jgi:hypothetical protein
LECCNDFDDATVQRMMWVHILLLCLQELICDSEKPLIISKSNCVADPEISVQAEEEAEPPESEKQETLDPDPKPELAKRKPPQVRPWDIGKEGLNEGELVGYFLVVLLLYLIIQ